MQIIQIQAQINNSILPPACVYMYININICIYIHTYILYWQSQPEIFRLADSVINIRVGFYSWQFIPASIFVFSIQPCCQKWRFCKIVLWFSPYTPLYDSAVMVRGVLGRVLNWTHIMTRKADNISIMPSMMPS